MALTNDNFLIGCEENPMNAYLVKKNIKLKDISIEQHLGINFHIINTNISM